MLRLAVVEPRRPARNAGTFLVVALGAFAAALGGVAAAADPALLALLLVAAGTGLALLLLPTWTLAPITLAVVIVGGLFREQWLTTGNPIGEFIGQGKIVAAMGILALLRLVAARAPLPMPRAAVLIVVVYIGAIVLSGIVAIARGNADLDLFASLRTHLSFMAAFAIGLVAMSQPGQRVNIARSVGLITALSGLASVLYWAWLAGHLIPPEPLLGVFETSFRFNGADAQRSDFPFPLDPNESAAVFVMLGAITAPVLLRSNRAIDTTLAGLLILAVAAAVMTTQSRTGLVLFGGASIIFVMSLRDLAKSARIGLVAALVAAGLLVVFAYSLFPESRDFSETSNFDARREAWADAVDDFTRYPLFGNGFGHASEGLFGRGSSIHNEFLGQLVDGGIVGMAAFLGVLGVFVAMALRVARAPGVRGGQGFAGLMFLAVLGGAMLTLTPWRLSVPLTVAWLAFGIISSEYITLQNESASAAPRATNSVRPLQVSPNSGGAS